MGLSVIIALSLAACGQPSATGSNERKADITVVPEYGAWTGWEEKQSLALIGGNAADAMQINWNWIDNYSNNGTNFLDLYEYSNIIDFTQFPQESLDQCSVDGKLMAIPVSNTGCLFYWNKSTFETIGCELPTDKESLLAAGAMVYYLESIYGRPWVENGVLQYTVEEIQEGFDFICELEEAHVPSPVMVICSQLLA